MRKLSKIIAPALVATLALGGAMPAQAVPYRGDSRHVTAPRPTTPVRNTHIRQEINGLNTAIDRAAARRTISQREAQGLRAQTRDLQRLYASYARNGLTRGEVQALESRVNRIQIALRAERRDWNSRRG